MFFFTFSLSELRAAGIQGNESSHCLVTNGVAIADKSDTPLRISIPDVVHKF